MVDEMDDRPAARGGDAPPKMPPWVKWLAVAVLAVAAAFIALHLTGTSLRH